MHNFKRVDMSIALDFKDFCIKGYIDSIYPVSGWLLAHEIIENVWIECDSHMNMCEYGLSRPDVVRRQNKSESQFIVREACGFREIQPCYYLKNYKIIVLVKIRNKGIVASSPVPANELEVLCLDPKAPLSDELAHPFWLDFLAKHFNKPGISVLEVGARRVTGGGGAVRKKFDKASYTGFDIVAGQDVNVVGDAHFLSTYFDEKFDLVLSSAVFEHFALPWVAAEEMARCVKIGGHIFVETHYSFSSHERPWHFFQFSEKALEILFCEAHGIKCLKSGVSTPLIANFSNLSASYLHGKIVKGLYCHSQFFGVKIGGGADLWKWDKDVLDSIYGNTNYPHRPELD